MKREISGGMSVSESKTCSAEFHWSPQRVAGRHKRTAACRASASKNGDISGGGGVGGSGGGMGSGGTVVPDRGEVRCVARWRQGRLRGRYPGRWASVGKLHDSGRGTDPFAGTGHPGGTWKCVGGCGVWARAQEGGMGVGSCPLAGGQAIRGLGRVKGRVIADWPTREAVAGPLVKGTGTWGKHPLGGAADRGGECKGDTGSRAAWARSCGRETGKEGARVDGVLPVGRPLRPAV